MLYKDYTKEEIIGDPLFFNKEELNICSKKSWKRLSNKTQVVPNLGQLETTHLNNRMTHSLKVGIISKMISNFLIRKYNLENIIFPDQVNNIALLHDIGHPPIGHYIEKEMNIIEEDIFFEGNANNIVIIEKEFKTTPLSKRTVLGTIKYPYLITREKDKGLYSSHKYLIEEYKNEVLIQYEEYRKRNNIKNQDKNPIRLIETQIMEIADDLSYLFHDFLDMLEYNPNLKIINNTKSGETKIIVKGTVYKNKFKIKLKPSIYNYFIFKMNSNYIDWEKIIETFIKKITILDNMELVLKDEDIINFLFNLREVESKVFYSERDNELKIYKARDYLKIFLNIKNLNNETFLNDNIKSKSYKSRIKEATSTKLKKQLAINYIAEMTDNWLIKSIQQLN